MVRKISSICHLVTSFRHVTSSRHVTHAAVAVNRPPFYDLGISGDFYSQGGDDFTASCIFSLNQEMTQNANDMVTKINDRIGEGFEIIDVLCADTIAVSVYL